MSGTVLWYISRATGVVSIALLTLVVVLGVVTAGRRRPRGDSATVVMGMHRWLSLGMVAFLALHIVTAIIDGYVSISWLSVLLPFTATYETLWIGLGTLAVDLILAVTVTSVLRHRLKESTWRWVHWASYALWPLAIMHGFVLATTSQLLLMAVTVLCAAIGAAAIGWRLTTSFADRDRRQAVREQEWA